MKTTTTRTKIIIALGLPVMAAQLYALNLGVQYLVNLVF